MLELYFCGCFFLRFERINAINPVTREIVKKSSVFRVKFTLPCIMLPTIKERTAYINAVNRLETKPLSGFFLDAIVLPANTPNTVPAMAEGRVYFSGKSVKQSRNAEANRTIKVIISDKATVFNNSAK